MTINILGVEYEIVDKDEREYPKIKEADGLCELYAHQIILDTSHKDEPNTYENIEAYYHKVLRHEAFHAFFAEMGVRKWFEDEELVDMLAMQYDKIKEIMDKCDAMEIYKLNGKGDDDYGIEYR